MAREARDFIYDKLQPDLVALIVEVEQIFKIF
jgi:hypothetical protein